MARNGSGIIKIGTGRAVRYKARYRAPNGTTDGASRSKTFTTRADAAAFLAKVRTSLASGLYVDQAAGSETLAAFVEQWLTARSPAWRPNTVRAKRSAMNHITRALGHLRLGAIRSSHVKGFGAGLDLAPSTKRFVLQVLDGVLASAVDDGLIATNPARTRSGRKVVTPAPRDDAVKRADILSLDDIAAVIAATPGHLRAAFEVMAVTGLRAGEAAGLTVESVDFLKRTLHVGQQAQRSKIVAPKTKASVRTIPLADRGLMALAEHLRHHPRPDGGLIFLGAQGGVIDSTKLASTWRKAADRVGVKTSGTHDLRHRVASDLLERGVSVVAVAALLGHASPTITLGTYAHLMPSTEDGLRAAMNAEPASIGAPLGPVEVPKSR